MAALTGDVQYQQKLRDAFVKRRLHPSTELRVWEYSIGRPKEHIEMTANVTMTERLAAERKLLERLSLSELEGLAAESQGLVDKALALVRQPGREALRAGAEDGRADRRGGSRRRRPGVAGGPDCWRGGRSPDRKELIIR